MHPKTIFAKTPKGVLEVKNKTTKLPRDIGVVFLSVDGKSTLTDLAKKAGMDEKVLTAALQKLTSDGFVKVFSSPDMTDAAPAAPATAASIAQAARGQAGGDDLDFTSPAAMAKLNTEAVNRTKAEAEAKARALAAAKAAAEAKVRQETETRARTQAEAKAKVEAEGKAKAEAAAKAASEARTKAEAEAKAAAGAQARAEAEGRIKAAMEAKTRADAEAKARHEAEIRAKQEAETKAASEAKAKEEADTRARAETEARALAEAETRAKTAVEAQMKALTDALGEAQRRARQEAEARVRVEAEIKSRQESERRARAEVEARAKAAEDAVVEARKFAEEVVRAKAHVESKAVMEAVAGGGDSARAHMESTLKALEEAKLKARSEAEARVDAEKRAKAEAEAHAREEQQRAERDVKERKERDEADQRTRAQLRELQEQARRATEEAEAKAAVERKGREEAEARVETERKAREEAERKAAAEAKAREESLAKLKTEAEAKARAEVEALIQAERKAREEAEQRAQKEIAANLEAEKRARAEAERQTEIARKAREEAERKSRDTGDSQAALRARAEAEIIARKAEEAVAQARAQADAERKARALAEDRAKTEAVARVMQEQQLRAGAEDQIKARVQEEIKARERAEMETEARYRQEQAARAKASAAEHRKREEEAKATGKTIRRVVRSNTNWPLTIGVVFVVALGIAIGLLHVVPLNNYIIPVQELMSKRLGVPVTITNLRYALFPAPQLTLHRVGIGKLQEVKVDSIVVSAWPMALFGENKRFDTAVLNTVTADQDALGMVPAWIKAQAGVLPVDLRRIELRGVKLAVKEIEVPPFNGDITFGPDGALQRAVLSTGKVKVDLTPRDRGFRAVLEASDYRLPLGPAVEFNDLVMEGTIEPQQAAITAISGKVGLRGVIKGSARASWGEGPIRVEGDFSVANGDLGPLLSDFTRDFTATGTLHANVTYAAQSQKLQSLFAQPAVEATFNIEKGVINNVDIVRAIQSPVREGLRGGKTGFNTLAGSMRLSNQSFAYRQLQLSSGPMRASGSVDIGSTGELSGRISAELGSKSVIVARGNLAVTGNLKTPVLK
jgi:hypothetical protein